MPAATEGVTSVLGEGSPHRARRASLKILSRNIGTVVLGNLLFDTWYYSPYPDNIILGPEYHPARHATTPSDLRNGHANTFVLNKTEPLCRRLFVCPTCFRYTPDERDYVQHLHHHRALREQGLETQPVPESAFKVYEAEGYAVWEIDGEKEKLYCQNLSLFGKLFLEQKSVFFDTAGFKYYALTYTPPSTATAAATASGAGTSAAAVAAVPKGRGRKRSSSVLDDDLVDRSQVLGFFSKEDLSWDSNNLACILIFPPFQHRQLGQLLMAVSYKLSGWEWEGGVIGGPEKPLSAMGRRSYLRFWSERIARFMMGQTADADAKRVFHNAKKRTVQRRREEMTVREIGKRTGMLGEDVVAALAEMGICTAVMPKRKKQKTTSLASATTATATAPAAKADTNGTAHHGEFASGDSATEDLATMIVHRSKVVEWAEKHGVELSNVVREEGFLGEWALSDLDQSNSNSDGEDSMDRHDDAGDASGADDG